MTDSTTGTDSTADIPSDAYSRLQDWRREWNGILGSAANQIPPSICPSLSDLASAKSRDELEKASKDALSKISTWRGCDAGTRSRIEYGTSQSIGGDRKVVVSDQKALEILGLVPSGNTRDTRDSALLARLAPHVQSFVEEKTGEMQSLLE